jgi:hypothetical protein
MRKETNMISAKVRLHGYLLKVDGVSAALRGGRSQLSCSSG